MARIGGTRAGAGRPLGAKNKRTIALEEECAAGGELPKGFMLRVMRDESQPMPLRADMAKAAAPYFHPRLNAIEQTGENGGPLIIILNEADANL
jgi:hypothetical protein